MSDIKERLDAWKRCIDGDDFSEPDIIRSHFNDLYLLLCEHVESAQLRIAVCRRCGAVMGEEHACSP